MRVELSWHVEDEDEEWETADAPAGHGWGRTLRYLWITVVLALLLAGSGYVALSRHQHTALQRIAFQIQSVIDLEAQTLVHGDVERFLAQQDQAAPGWVTGQAEFADRHCAQAGLGASFLTAEVRRVELWGDVAWVEVTVGEEPLRQVRFYRQTALGWLHTVPQARFWRDPVERTDGPVTVQAHERDWPYVQPLVQAARQAVEDLCAGLSCPSDRGLELRVVPDAGQTPGLLGDTIMMPSPWLSGIPPAGVWDEGSVAEVRYWAAYVAARKAMDPPFYYDLSPRQRVVLAEYAALYAAGDPSAASVVPRILACRTYVE